MIPATTVLDPGSAMLVVVDVQERLAAAMTKREQVVRQTALLIRTAAIMGLPIVVTRQYPRGLGDTDAEVTRVLEQACDSGTTVTVVDKTAFDCFAEEEFVHAVCGSGRRQLLLTGMETHICITQTALAGVREGFDVHVAADACCSREEENRTLALSRLGNAGVVVTTTESAAYELVGRAGTDEFRRLLQAVKESDAAAS